MLTICLPLNSDKVTRLAFEISQYWFPSESNRGAEAGLNAAPDEALPRFAGASTSTSLSSYVWFADFLFFDGKGIMEIVGLRRCNAEWRAGCLNPRLWIVVKVPLTLVLLHAW